MSIWICRSQIFVLLAPLHVAKENCIFDHQILIDAGNYTNAIVISLFKPPQKLWEVQDLVDYTNVIFEFCFIFLIFDFIV